MSRIEGRTREGEAFVLWQSLHGDFYCPVCGTEVSACPPYSVDGDPSFEMCGCGFEYGYDDSPLASPAAVGGLVANWRRWRGELIRQAASDPARWAALQQTLANIHVRLGPAEVAIEEPPAAGDDD